MSSTYFSSIQSQPIQQSTSNRMLPLKEGQVIHGSIIKLFPNETAELQIGTQKVIAKLEIPLQAGNAHFFQVTKSEPNLQLKVVSEPLIQSNSSSQATVQLMKAMNLSNTKEMQVAVQFFLKEQIPIAKDQLIQAEQLLKQLPTNVTMKSALESIQKMTELKIPLTPKLFETVISGKSKEGLHSLLQSFKAALLQDTTISINSKSSLLQILQKLTEPFEEPAAGVVLGKQIETLQNTQVSISIKLPILQALKQAGILPIQATLSQPTFPLTQATLKNTAGELMGKLVQATPNEKETLMEQVKNWVSSQVTLSITQKEQILSVLKNRDSNGQIIPINNALIKAFSEQSQNAVFLKDENGISPKEHLLSLLGKSSGSESFSQSLQQILKISKSSSNSIISQQMIQSEETVLQQLDGKAFEHAMKEVLKTLGFSYEARLGGNSEEIRQIAFTLKPQLVELIQHQTVSANVKEQAELVLGRMNGLQLLSNENGPQHQLLMQVPLEFLGKKMDATLEWKGRMLENGKIDPEFARIMFYLQLEALEETVIDMQVQNRIVTINLFNHDANLQSQAEMLKESLKKGLQAVGYQLSGVFVKTFEEQKLSSKINVKSSVIETQGVDIRI
jgi:hypothetical protein